MRKIVKLTEEGLKNLISKSINGIINEGMYGYPDDCDQIILAYQHDRESMELYESIIQTLLKKRKKGVNLSFDVLVNSGVMKKFQQYVFRKFKQYQDTPMLRSTPYTFREYVANRMIEQIENGEYELKENKETNMNKKLIRLTESDLHRIVKESVKKIIKENKKTKKVVREFDEYDDFEDDDNLDWRIDDICMEFGDGEVLINGVLGLWNGKRRIEPTPCSDIRSAIQKCIGRDGEIMSPNDIWFDGETVSLKVCHHDGTNNFEITHYD